MEGGKGDGTRRCGDPRCRRHWTRALSRPQPPPRREDDQKGPVRWVRREARRRGGRDGKLRRGAERRLGPPPHTRTGNGVGRLLTGASSAGKALPCVCRGLPWAWRVRPRLLTLLLRCGRRRADLIRKAGDRWAVCRLGPQLGRYPRSLRRRPRFRERPRMHPGRPAVFQRHPR